MKHYNKQEDTMSRRYHQPTDKITTRINNDHRNHNILHKMLNVFVNELPFSYENKFIHVRTLSVTTSIQNQSLIKGERNTFNQPCSRPLSENNK